MYCGSCLHDNAMAKALSRLGHDTMLIPTYTPILTDEADNSRRQLFFGGLNVYLQQMSPVFRWLPKWADSFLSAPKLVGWVASRAMGTSAKNLGALTLSMLQGSHGNQRKEVERLCAWLKSEKPDVVVFSNLLIAGCIPEVHEQVGCPAVVVLQGDDIFYDSLIEPYREQAMVELQRLTQQVDLFITHSQDYAVRMQEMLGFQDDQYAVNPLGIDTTDFETWDHASGLPQLNETDLSGPAIGYLARIAPEKGLDILVDAFLPLAEKLPTARLEIAGWLGSQHEAYWQEQQDKLAAAGLKDRYRYHGSVDRAGKLEFLRSIDVLSVPTPYLEPKGLFVLEGLAAGVPYVQPAHGAYPEIFERLGGGVLFPPESADVLADELVSLLQDEKRLRDLSIEGRASVLEKANTTVEAARFASLLEKVAQSA